MNPKNSKEECGFARRTMTPALGLILLLAGLVFSTGLPAMPATGSPASLEKEIREIEALHEDGRYPQAYERGLDLLARVEASKGAESLEVATVLDHVAREQTACQRKPWDLAETRVRRALRIKERLLDRYDPGLAETLMTLGKVLQLRLEHPESLEAFQRALGIRAIAFGPESAEAAEALAYSGTARQWMDDHDGALKDEEMALAILDKTGKGDRAMVLLELARRYLDEGRFEEGKDDALESLRILEQTFRPDHPRIGWALNTLGLALAWSGDLAGGIEVDRKALEIREPLDPAYSQIGSTYLNLGLKMLALGDYDEAYRLTTMAWKSGLALNGPDHPSAGHGPNNLGEILLAAGKYEEAAQMLEEAIRIKERVNGPEHLKLLTSLDALARVRIAMGNYEEAERLLRRALAIDSKWHGQNKAQSASLLDRLAGLEVRRGDLDKAQSLATQALEIRTRLLGLDHPDTAVSMVTLAQVALDRNRTAEALRRSLEADSILRGHMQRTAHGLSEREALRYEAIRSLGLDIALSIAVREGGAGVPAAAVPQAWDATIRSRALVLDEIGSRHRLALDAKDDRSRELVSGLEEARSRLARIALQGQATPRDLARAREKEEAAERALAPVSERFREQLRREAVGLADVQRMLPSRWAIVSYVQFREATRQETDNGQAAPATDRLVYAAFALSGDGKGPRVVSLGSASWIDGLVRRWRSEAGVPPADEKSEATLLASGRDLRKAIWDPVSRGLPAVDGVLVVPVGAINLVSLAALPSERQGYLLESGPSFQYLSAERDLVRSEEPVAGQGMLALGGPDFDAGGMPGKGSPSVVTSLTRGPASACGGFRSMRFSSLPGSKAEVEEVEALFKGAQREGRVEVLLGSAADEEAFKKKAPGRRILHLATHGFFLDDRCASELQSTREGTRSLDASSAGETLKGENPLVLSGLAMAGANQRDNPASELRSEDGLLTAMEVASLDLRGVEWAVLSGCATGVGPVLAGEGVVGMRRAFQIAGARSVIMSLWEVKDLPARDWIKRLYEARLSGLTTVESVRRASLDTLQARRKAGVSTHPFYWGAFISSGDWR